MKVILVIDMPDYTDFETLKKADIQIVRKDTGKHIYRMARLKPLPQKKPKDNSSELNLGYELGYNDCIDEILEGAENNVK